MISITNNPLNLNDVISRVEDQSAGAVTIFMGRVRSKDKLDGKVSEIYYEAYIEMAEEKMREIENEVHINWGIEKVIVFHRIGNIKAGESSIIIAVSSEHRREAFEACEYIINNVKTRVPIWKKEIYQVSERWVDGILLE